MFKFLTPKPDADPLNVATIEVATAKRWCQTSPLLAATLIGTLLLTGCQQQTEPTADNNDIKTNEQIRAEDEQVAVQSDSAAARIEQFQPLYVAQAQSLQRRLQAEYEALQVADASDSDNGLLSDNATELSNKEDAIAINTDHSAMPAIDNASATKVDVANINAVDDIDADSIDLNSSETEINTSTEIGERDLEVLKRISLEPRETKPLTEAQISERYQQAMQALYQPVSTPFSAQDIDTLLNIATLVPQLFEHAEIAGRVSAKSPALARLIIQHQVWEQIEAQQVLDMQQMKLVQQQEFEMLMTKFNDTIKGYDEQITKYEQTLKAFQ